MRKIVIFGITGSIGSQTVEVLREDDIIVGASFNNNIDKMNELIDKYHIQYVINDIYDNISDVTIFRSNELDSFFKLLDQDTIVVNAVSGVAGIKYSYHTLKNGFNLYLANKESMVIYGDELNRIKEVNNLKIIPIDSEHNSLLKLLNNVNINQVNKLYITASGGSLRNKTYSELEDVTVEEALSHPNWLMGKGITIDSSTMVNKAYEVVEASRLFNFELNKVKVIKHHESLIHALIEMNDGSILAALNINDMKNAINYAINYPDYIEYPGDKLNINTKFSLNFEVLDIIRYPLFLKMLTYLTNNKIEALISVIANEISVNKFLNQEIKYLDIESNIDRIVKIYSDQYQDYELNIDNIEEITRIINLKER